MNEPVLAGRLTEIGHELDVRVYFEDTDFSGVVYHARYLNFLERGRTDLLRLKGIGHRQLAEGVFGEPVSFVVVKMEIAFLRPARIDDVLRVETSPKLVGGARIILNQAISREGEKLVEATVKVAVVSADGRPKRMPDAVAAILVGQPVGR